ncbi:hypothetical protein IH575_00250 [Candidatus Dojkabacteria bacterium]|nr:hypothetical protein [Candidatus Dojkabacteria bacterium]
MARPTKTRAQLRRELAIRMMMPFAVRMPDGYSTVSAAGTTVQLIDTVNLLQANDFWNGQWAYIMGTTERLRKISDFAQTGSIATLEYALPAVLSTADTYEIHSVFNAIEMNNAINQAIRDGFPAFFDTTEDTSLIICENKMEYDLTGLTTPMHHLHEVWVERPSVRIYATAVSGVYGAPSTVITLEDTDLSNVTTNWRISCYDGDGEGLEAAVASVNDGANTVTVTGDLSDIDVGDKIHIWDTREQYIDWYRLRFFRSTPREWANKLHLYTPIDSYVGCRLKLIYSTVPQVLTSDTGTTVVPPEYIMLSAMATLYSSRIGDNRVDRQRYGLLAEQYGREAEIYKQFNSFRAPQTEIQMEGMGNSYEDMNIDGNPMGW